MCHRSKKVSGFHKRVGWRLQATLNSRSADFLHAAWALRASCLPEFSILTLTRLRLVGLLCVSKAQAPMRTSGDERGNIGCTMRM